PWFFSAISWTELSAYDKLLANIGTTGQFVSIILIIAAIFNIWTPIKQTFSRLTIFCLGGIFLLLFFKSSMELGLISTPLAALVFETRSVIIGYLHFTLLGFISLFILTQYQMIGFINTNSRLVL